MRYHLLIIVSFSLGALRILFLLLFFYSFNNNVSWRSLFWIEINRYSVCFLYLRIQYFPKVCGFFCQLFVYVGSLFPSPASQLLVYIPTILILLFVMESDSSHRELCFFFPLDSLPPQESFLDFYFICH